LLICVIVDLQKKIMDDVPNFSDKQPMLIPGIVKGTM